MHHHLVDAAASLEVDLPNLAKAATRSANIRAQAQKELRRLVAPSEYLDVVAFGSLAREEATAESDLDYVVAVHRLPDDVTLTRRLLDAVERTREKLGLAEPGATKMFGAVMSATDIAERIGLEQDTNLNHSRRILMFQESVSIYQPALHKQLLRALLDRYLVDYKEPKDGVPRFLLNDILRYWRTLSVDYQAKRWESRRPDWGLRYLKLLISRKLAHVGSVIPVLLTEKATPDYFVEQFTIPAVARIAQLHERLEGEFLDHLRTVLTVADDFIKALGDCTFRTEAKRITARNRGGEGTGFTRMRAKAKDLQRALQEIFFSSPVLRQRAVKYLSF